MKKKGEFVKIIKGGLYCEKKSTHKINCNDLNYCNCFIFRMY